MSEMHFGLSGRTQKRKSESGQEQVQKRVVTNNLQEHSCNKNSALLENEKYQQQERENDQGDIAEQRRKSPRKAKKKRVMVDAEVEEDYQISRGQLSDESVAQKRSYNFIDPDVKEQLIEFLSTGKYTIKQAAAKFGINYSTAKYLFKKYRAELVEEEEEHQRPINQLMFSSVPPEPANIEEILGRVAKVGNLAAQMSVEADPPREQLISLLKEMRKLLDLTLVRIQSIQVNKQQGLLQEILHAHQLLDWHFIALGVSNVETQQIDDSIIEHLKALLILAHGLVQKKVKPDGIQPNPI